MSVPARVCLVDMRAIGDAEEASYMGRKLATWKNNKPSAKIDWHKALELFTRELNPILASEIVEASTETKPGARVLRIAKTKE